MATPRDIERTIVDFLDGFGNGTTVTNRGAEWFLRYGDLEISLTELSFAVAEALAKRRPLPGETIISVAIRHRGMIVAMPAPARHGDVLKPLYDLDGELVGPEDQGFLTSTGRFVGRIEAADIARLAGQIAKLSWPPFLYSEDLW